MGENAHRPHWPANAHTTTKFANPSAGGAPANRSTSIATATSSQLGLLHGAPRSLLAGFAGPSVQKALTLEQLDRGLCVRTAPGADTVAI